MTARILRLLRTPVLWWAFGVALAIALIVRTPFAADMSAFLPRSAEPSQQILVDQLREGVASRLILVALSGAAPDALAALSKTLAADLRGHPDIVLVSNGDIDALKADRDYLWRNRYLLSPKVTPARFSVEGLHAALEDDLAMLGSQMGLLVKQSLPNDPTGEILALGDLLAGDARPASRDGVWFSPKFERALLMVQSRVAGFDLDGQARVIGAIEAAFAAARQATPGASTATLTVTGPPVFAVNSRAQIQGDAMRFSLIATGLVALILLLAYRSPRILVLALIPVASGALAGIAVVGLVFGSVHGITLGFGVALIGEAVDYSIYLFSRVAPDQPPRATLKVMWPTLRLGLLTSLVGFSAMLFSSFTGFVQLGLFVMTGLTTAALTMRFVLPHFLPSGFAGVQGTWFGRHAVAAIGRMSRLWWAVPACAALGFVALLLHHGSYWEDELQSMNPVPRADQLRDQALRNDMGAPDVRYMVLVRASDMESALSRAETLDGSLDALIEAEALDGFDAPYFYLPSVAEQTARRAAIPETSVLAANLRDAAQGLPFKADLFAPFLADAEAAREQTLLTRSAMDGTALALKFDALLLKRADGVVAMLPLRGVTDIAAIRAKLIEPGKSDVLVLDLKGESDRLLSSYLREAQTLAVLGGVTILTLLALALRSARRVLQVAAPLGAAVVVTTAILTVGPHQLSVFNLFGLLLVVAIGSNYTLFFESEDLGSARGPRIITSLVLANLCTVLAFGILSFSGIPVMHGIGMTVAIGTALSLVFGALLARPGAHVS